MEFIALAPARFVVADLSRQEEVEQLAAAAGQVDILVASAGIPASGQLVTFSVEEIDRTLNVNLRSAAGGQDASAPPHSHPGGSDRSSPSADIGGEKLSFPE